jgi:hypothetical protein
VSANGIGGPPTGGAAAQPPLIKEVETTCLYNLPKGLGAPNSNGKPLQFEALQRTATYLRPSNQVLSVVSTHICKKKSRKGQRKNSQFSAAARIDYGPSCFTTKSSLVKLNY